MSQISELANFANSIKEGQIIETLNGEKHTIISRETAIWFATFSHSMQKNTYINISNIKLLKPKTLSKKEKYIFNNLLIGDVVIHMNDFWSVIEKSTISDFNANIKISDAYHTHKWCHILDVNIIEE